MPAPKNVISQLAGILPDELDPEMMAQMGFMLPGNADELMMHAPAALGGFDMRELMALMNPPPVASNGVKMPEANNSGLVRTDGRMQMPRTQPTARPATGRTELQQRQRAAQKMEIRRGQQQRRGSK